MYNSPIFHPCSQMKDYENFPPLEIIKAQGSFIYDKNNKAYFDAISSWWCKSLGHAHPRLQKALIEQSNKFEHVILANTQNDTILKLSTKLLDLAPHLSHVFYGGDGSTAVEIAVKMAIQARKIRSQAEKNKFIALSNGYHGETLMCLSLSDLGIYKDVYQEYLHDVKFIDKLPYVTGKSDPLWSNAAANWLSVKESLEKIKDTLNAICLEPILQGAGGMLIYSPDFLKSLAEWAKLNDVYIIADEILTGFYRTGEALASDHAAIKPDLICLSKGLTAGFMPMSAVLLSQEMYSLFYADYQDGKSFLHSNTYAGNALAAAVALEALNIYQEENIKNNVIMIESEMLSNKRLLEQTFSLKNLRSLGAVSAIDIDAPSEKRLGLEVYKVARNYGAILRPLGNTIYWLPPLNSSKFELDMLSDITYRALKKVLG